MFGLFKRDPRKKLQQEYDALQQRARDVQRGGDVVAAAKLYEQAEAVLAKIDALDDEPSQA